MLALESEEFEERAKPVFGAGFFSSRLTRSRGIHFKLMSVIISCGAKEMFDSGIFIQIVALEWFGR